MRGKSRVEISSGNNRLLHWLHMYLPWMNVTDSSLQPTNNVKNSPLPVAIHAKCHQLPFLFLFECMYASEPPRPPTPVRLSVVILN